jgi:pseudo-rSAM protein
MKEKATDYWFIIEPYVFIGLTNQYTLLYNTLDKIIIESDKIEVINLLRELIQKDNYGVILLTEQRYRNNNIKDFVRELREKYMGDIIDVSLSKGKPIQLLPFFNFSDTNKLNIYKIHNFSSDRNILKNLFEINIHLNFETNVAKLISFLKSIPGSQTFNIIGNIGEVTNYSEILSYLDQYPSPKNILCSYKHLIALQPDFENNFSYRVSIDFPIDEQQWNRSSMILLRQALPVEYVFDVSSFEDCQQAEQLVEKFQIEKYRLNPVYTGDNIQFFEENVFLSKEDILSTTMTIKDFFSRQAINLYDFGKINILPTGDVYANLNHPVLGNIYTDNIYEIIQKEIDDGKSWFNIRNHAPCNNCVYQWFCPSPSDYEITIGRTNLCYINNN